MPGSKRGVAKQIKIEEERALYTHFYAHSINLAVEVCSVLTDTIHNTYELTKLVKMPPKRDAKLHSIQADNNSSSSNEVASLLMDIKTPP